MTPQVISNFPTPKGLWGVSKRGLCCTVARPDKGRSPWWIYNVYIFDMMKNLVPLCFWCIPLSLCRNLAKAVHEIDSVIVRDNRDAMLYRHVCTLNLKVLIATNRAESD